MLTFFTGFVIVGVFVFGAVIGSFLHVVAARYVSARSFLKGRSECVGCGKALAPIELIPILSYTYSGARCRGCGIEIPMNYPLVEFVSGMLAVFIMGPAVLTQEGIFLAIALYAAACVLLILIRIDTETMTLPDGFIYILGIIVAFIVLIHRASIDSIAFGMLAGVLPLYALWLVTRGAGIGFGDVKLMIPLGALFGFEGAVTLLFLAFVLGGVYGTFLLITGRVTPKTAVPFGPFLASSAFALMVAPEVAHRFFMVLGVY